MEDKHVIVQVLLDSGKYQGLFGLAKMQTMARPNSPWYFPESSKNLHDYI